MKYLRTLRREDPSSSAAYHLEGLLEAAAGIRSLVVALGGRAAANPELTAETLTFLQVEIYSHLAYHMKHLRRPLQRLIDAAYKQVPDLEVPADEPVSADSAVRIDAGKKPSD